MSPSAKCASPPPAGGSARGERRGVARPSVRGSRSRSHTGPRSGAEPPRQAALSLQHECRRTCAARGPNRMPAAAHRRPSPVGQTPNSHRPEAVRGTPSDGLPDAPPCGLRCRHRRQRDDRHPARGGYRRHSTTAVRFWCGRCRDQARAASCRQQTPWATTERCSASVRAGGPATSRRAPPSCIMWNDPG